MTSIYEDFTKRDFTSNYERLLDLLTHEVPELSDRNHSDAGIALIRLLARQTDMLSFYIDEVFMEGFVRTAKFRQSLIDLGTLVDCRPKLSSPAMTTLRITRTNTHEDALSKEIVIPAYHQFYRSDGLQYITLDKCTIPPHQMSIDVDVIQAERHQLSVTDHDFEHFAFYRRMTYNLGQGVVSGMMTLYDVDSEWYWTEVDSFFRSQATDTHFMLELYADLYDGVPDTVFLVLGDGVFGSDKPPRSSEIVYFTTSGADGNCGAGVIDSAYQSAPLGISVTNIIPATGGAGPESTERFRARLPLVVQTQRRGFTESDYEALINSIPGVLCCNAVSRSSDVSWPYMYIFLYVIPEGGGKLHSALKRYIVRQCKRWGHFGDWDDRYVVLDAIQRVIDIKINVGKKFGFQTPVVESGIRTSLQQFFAPESVRLGRVLSFEDLYKSVSSVAGVDWVQFLSPTTSLSAEPGETFVLGSLDITFRS